MKLRIRQCIYQDKLAYCIEQKLFPFYWVSCGSRNHKINKILKVTDTTAFDGTEGLYKYYTKLETAERDLKQLIKAYIKYKEIKQTQKKEKNKVCRVIDTNNKKDVFLECL